MATSNRKSAAFVLTKEGKASIFKQNDGISLNLTKFALFRDKNLKLKRLLESSEYDYSIFENLKYDYFNNENFELKPYDNSLTVIPRIENGERILCLNVDVFNKGDITEDQTYDGIIYFCNAYSEQDENLSSIYEEQNANTIYAIQYFAVNKITLLANQDKRIKFAIQLRFTQNNYEVIDLNIPEDIDNGLRIYNDALSNLSLRSKTIGTNRSLTIGDNSNEIGSMLDIYSDDGNNQVRMLSLKQTDLGEYVISNEVDAKFADNEFILSGSNVKSFELFSNDNENAGISLFAFSDNNIIDESNTGKYTFLNSNENTASEPIAGTLNLYGNTYIDSNENESIGGNNTFIGSDEIVGNDSENAFIASNSISFTKPIDGVSYNHNTFINEKNDDVAGVKNFVAIGGQGSKFVNIENGLAIGHHLNVGNDDVNKKLKDIVVLGKYNAPIEEDDIFVLGNGVASKPNNVFKVNSNAEITINDGTNKTTISPIGIGYNDNVIEFDVLEQIVNNQTTLNDLNDQVDTLEEAVLNIVNNGLMNKSFILDVDNTFNVDEHVTAEEKMNNLMVTLYNPFENEVTVTYRYRQKTAMFNPQTETITVGNKSTIQLLYIDNDDYKGFVQVR